LIFHNGRKPNQRPRRNNNRPWNSNSHNKPRNGNKPRTNKRYGYRTKQNKIEKVYAAVTKHFEELGVLSPEDVGIRGTNVARLHVKKWHSLCRIEEAIVRVEDNPFIVTQRVSCPVSMKNLYQKKGFLIYWETETEAQTQALMDIFRSFDEKDREGKFILDEFQKISVAMQTTEQKDQTETVTEQDASAFTKNIVSKASVASLDNEVKTLSTFEAFSGEDTLAFDDELAFEDSKELAFSKAEEFDDEFNVLPLRKMTSTNSLCGA